MATVSDKRHAGGRPRKHEPSDLYRRVESLAKRRGMHLDDLAAAAGVGVSTLYRLHDPRVSTVRAIAAVLGVTIDRLLGPPRRSARRASA